MSKQLSSDTPTIADVARLAGVSTATVSRVINRSALVDGVTVSRVQAAMRDLKYVPRTAARNLALRKTHTIGLLLTDIQGDFFTPMLNGVESAAREAGFNLLIATTGVRDPRDEFPSVLGPHNADGLLVFTNSLGKSGLAYYHELGFPVVLIHQTPPDGLNIPSVTVENKAASKKLVDHLIEVHHRQHIAFLRGPEEQEDSHWRELGHRDALEAHGLAVDPGLIALGEFDRSIAAQAVKHLLKSGTELDAVFAGDDEAALGVLDALRQVGRRVPADIAVVGFDDQRLSAYLSPPLTTVRAPTDRVGSEATRQLVKLIETGQADPLTLLPTEMVIRSSCGCGEPVSVSNFRSES